MTLTFLLKEESVRVMSKTEKKKKKKVVHWKDILRFEGKDEQEIFFKPNHDPCS